MPDKKQILIRLARVEEILQSKKNNIIQKKKKFVMFFCGFSEKYFKQTGNNQLIECVDFNREKNMLFNVYGSQSPILKKELETQGITTGIEGISDININFDNSQETLCQEI